MKYDIILHQKNYSTTLVECSQNIASELNQYMSAMAPNFRFMPLYKAGMWDGRLRFFNSSDHSIPSGLVERIYEFAGKGGYTVDCKYERENNIDRAEFKRFVDALKIPFTIRDYQFEAAYDACCKKQINVHISTAGGKSLTIYIVCRFLMMLQKKVILIVPTTQLTEQMLGDFQSYGWDAENFCHTIYSGQKKVFDAPVIISTWQSLYRDKKLFAEFDCMIIDEAQGGKAKELQGIAKSAINAEYRFGFSGTFPEAETADWFAIVGATGPVKTFATYSTLQKAGHIAQIKIYTVKLQYEKDFRIRVYQEGDRDYHVENDIIYSEPKRCLFLCRMVQKMDENVLVLFQKKEKHGHLLRDLFQHELRGKEILYVDGTIDVLDRDEYRKIMEGKTNVVLLATYATLSAGVNIKNLPNIIFASSYKSKIKILQSIGRGLRLHKDKKHLKLYDIVDDVCFRTKDVIFINHSLKHYKERKKYYDAESWPVKEILMKI
jgi:superfamily II DNA or RNA helicase